MGTVTQSEASIQRAIKAALQKRGWVVYKSQSQGRGSNGLPDLLCVKQGYPPVMLEVKRPSKTPTELQWAVIHTLNRNGMKARVVNSVSGAVHAVEGEDGFTADAYEVMTKNECKP